MIIQCNHCSAKFKIDDARLAKGAVKVRCAKCKEVFVVEKEETQTESVQVAEPAVSPALPAEKPAVSDGGFGDDTDFSFDQEAPSGNAPAEIKAPMADEFDWKDTSVKIDSESYQPDFDPTALSSETITSSQNSEPPAVGLDQDFDFGDLDLSASEGNSLPSPVQDDFAIDFSSDAGVDQTLSASSSADTSVASSADFSFDTAPKQESSPDHDDFLLSFKNESEPKPQAGYVAESENVNFGDFSFGEMGVNDDSGQRVTADLSHSPSPQAALTDEELVPSALTSRKKAASRFPLFLILGAILLVVALAGSGLFFFAGPQAFSKLGLGFLVDWYGKNAADEGSMTVRNVVPSYIGNSNVGELFVVKGEVVNNFKKPRASVQVKVSVIGPGGAVLLSKSAFCGNSLSSEQLTTLPLTKLDEAMNNQFGDSLVNLGVKPGSAIPFVVAIGSVPKTATDFSVQVVGSTVATQ